MKNIIKSKIKSIYIHSAGIKRHACPSLLLIQYAAYFSSGIYYSSTIFYIQLIGLALAMISVTVDLWPKKLKNAQPLIWVICIAYSGLYPSIYIGLASGLESFSLLNILLNLIILSLIIDSESLMVAFLLSLLLSFIAIYISNDYIGMLQLSNRQSLITISLGAFCFACHRKIISINNANVKSAIRSLTSEISNPISNLAMLSGALDNLYNNIPQHPSRNNLKEDLHFLQLIAKNISQESNTALNRLNGIMHIYINEYQDLGRHSIIKSIQSLLLTKIYNFVERDRIIFNYESDIFFYGSKNAVEDMIEGLLISAFKEESSAVEISIKGLELLILQKGIKRSINQANNILLSPDKTLLFNISGYICAIIMKKLNGHVTCNTISNNSILFILTFPDLDC